MIKQNNKYFKIIVSLLLVNTLISTIFLSAKAESNGVNSNNKNDNIVINNEYSDYLEEYNSVDYATEEIILNTDLISDAENKTIIEEESIKSVIISADNKFITYSFNVQKDGLFNIGLYYKPIKDTAMDIRLSFEFDGVLPYSELNDVSFSRIWIDSNEKPLFDDYGDQLRPEQVEKFAFRNQWAENDLGLYQEPYAVYLEAGNHTLKIKRVAESIAISAVVLKAYKAEIPNYETYISQYESINNASKDYIIEAEDAFQKSHSTLAATTDSGNAGMSPVSAKSRVINSFGQGSWTENGQWASWNVPETLKEGMYVVRFRAKQNGDVGTTTYRKLLINGKVPFTEAESIGFDYYDGWQIATFGAENPYLIYLKPGDVLTLSATTGPMAEPLSEIYDSVNMLNEIYQSIIMVTGTSPDSERDYNIQREIPTLLDDFKNARKQIANIRDSISEIMGENNPKVFFINKFLTLLDSFTENYRLIVPELGTYKSYIDSYAGETYDFNTLPLELDTILLMSPESDIPSANVGFWKTLSYEVKRFFCSFTDDYIVNDDENKKDGKTITVWCSLGRDQAQSVKQIIENDFTPKTGIYVDFKIASTSLSEAILSGKEPDVSLSVTQEVPIDLAIRGQALDLSKYLDKMPEEYMDQFHESSWVPFKYNGGIYAMPITQGFTMLYYRTDVFNKLGLTVPKTWSEFYTVIRELQRNNFQVGIQESDANNPGISASIGIYETLLLQQGEEYFNTDLTEVNFESTGGKQAFLDWVKLYRDFEVDKDFDLNSRFRSGEMPLAIASYSFCLTLQTVAPEISGRYAMVAIPATIDDNGKENRAVSSAVSGTVVLKGAEKRGNADAAFEFVSWWAGAEAQVKFSNSMEALQGVSGRQAVANIEAFRKLGWSQEEIELVETQWKDVEAIPQVPGTYIINRHLTSALRQSYNEKEDPLRQLAIQCRNINTELARKRAEFEKNN